MKNKNEVEESIARGLVIKQAIYEGNLTKFKENIKDMSAYELNKPLPQSCFNPIQLAARKANVYFVKALVAKGVRSDLLDVQGRGLVHVATHQTNIPLLKFLVNDLKLDVNQRDKGMQYPFVPFICDCMEELHGGLERFIEDERGYNTLRDDPFQVKYTQVAYFIKPIKMAFNYFMGFTPEEGTDIVESFKKAILARDENLFKEGLQKIRSELIDIDAPLPNTCFNPLQLAVKIGHLSFVKALLNYGADITITEELSDATLLHLAAREGHLDISEFLKLQIKSSHQWNEFHSTKLPKICKCLKETEGTNTQIEADSIRAQMTEELKNMYLAGVFGEYYVNANQMLGNSTEAEYYVG